MLCDDTLFLDDTALRIRAEKIPETDERTHCEPLTAIHI